MYMFDILRYILSNSDSIYKTFTKFDSYLKLRLTLDVSRNCKEFEPPISFNRKGKLLFVKIEVLECQK